MKKVLFALIVVILLNVFPYFIGYRDYNQTIINYIIAVFVFIPLGIWLKEELYKRIIERG